MCALDRSTLNKLSKLLDEKKTSVQPPDTPEPELFDDARAPQPRRPRAPQSSPHDHHTRDHKSLGRGSSRTQSLRRQVCSAPPLCSPREREREEAGSRGEVGRPRPQATPDETSPFQLNTHRAMLDSVLTGGSSISGC